tara:strand:- start:85 stop:528 length:444 start_codon:yes stop_codon:yes gene_type:complete
MNIYILLIIIIVSSFLYVILERYTEPKIFNPILSLYPIQDKDHSCKDMGFKIATTPHICIKKDGEYDIKSNCKCTDNNNFCTVCYDSINMDIHKSNILKTNKDRQKMAYNINNTQNTNYTTQNTNYNTPNTNYNTLNTNYNILNTAL